MDRYLTQSAIGVGGSIALLLGGLGVYGVIGFTVATGSREIAVRMTGQAVTVSSARRSVGVP